MHTPILTLLLLTVVQLSSLAQKDSLKVKLEFQLQARLQSGNLNQYGGNVGMKLGIQHSKWNTELSASYTYITVEDFNSINDSWNFLSIRKGHNNRFYPTALTYYGFAKSFGIDQSVAQELGVGVNLVNKSKHDYLRFNALAGYMEFDYQSISTVSTSTINTFVQANSRIVEDKLVLHWELHAYNALKNSTFYGFQNKVLIGFPVSKRLMITLTSQQIYNQTVDVGKKQLNTLSLFGVQLR